MRFATASRSAALLLAILLVFIRKIHDAGPLALELTEGKVAVR